MEAYLSKEKILKISDGKVIGKVIHHRLYVPENKHYILFLCKESTDPYEFRLSRSEILRKLKGEKIEIPDETAKKLKELFYEKGAPGVREILTKELEELLAQTKK